MVLMLATALAGTALAAPNLVPNGDFHDGLNGWNVTNNDTCHPALVDAKAGAFTTAVQLKLNPNPGANPWDITLSRPIGEALAKGTSLRINVWMRSPEACPVNVIFQLGHAPWSTLVGQTLTPGADWTQYVLRGSLAQETAAGEGTISFQLGKQAGTVEIAGVEMMTVPDNPLGLIPFVLPWDDNAAGVTNVSAWLDKPAGTRGFVTVRDGHLYTGDRRLRLLGTNITANCCFPTHADAEKVAARLAKFGINCVRFHHMDSAWANPGILQDDRLTLAPEQVDRLDYFIAQLKRNGIYADLNLHVSREYPNMPRWEGMPDFFKGVDNFYPPMLKMQHDYARDLLTHVNPYTGNAYAAEPAVAIVEINNENGLIGCWRGGQLDQMPDVYQKDLSRQWNEWLKAKYADDATLKRAWAASSKPLGAEMLDNGDFHRQADKWTLEIHEGTTGSSEARTDGPDGKPALRINAAHVDGVGWHVQFHQPGLKVEAGKLYTLRFQARADSPREVSLDCKMAHEPWENFWAASVEVTSEWKQFALVVTPSASDDNGRITFGNLGVKTGSIDLAGVSFRPGASYEPRPGDALGTVAAIRWTEFGGLPPEMQADWMSFLWDTEQGYWTGMSKYLKDDLKVHAVIIGTAVGFSSAAMQAKLDAVDGHAYWYHPMFPSKPWDAIDWVVENKSMAGAPGGGTLPGLALSRVAGKPFTVTEYQHPAPNTHNSEAFLLLAAYGAMQDWDGIFSFCYGSNRDNWDAKMITSFFAVDQHPTQMATMAAAAALFLRGDVAVPKTKAVGASTAEQTRQLLRTYGPWFNAEAFGIKHMTAMQRPVEMSLDGKPAAPGPAATAASPFVSDGGQLTWDYNGGDGCVTINAPKSKAAIGGISGGPFNLGGVIIAPKPNIQNWAAITLTVMEGTSFTEAGRLLITATAYAENTAMGWKDERKTSVGAAWGHAPSIVEGVPATITLPVAAGRVKVWALDERSQRMGPVAVRDEGGKAVFDLGPEHKTLWYEAQIQ
jgi:hypothetical protein